jgi:hypothetical protein
MKEISMEAPNPKLQAPEKPQTQSSNRAPAAPGAPAPLELGTWSFFGVWSLGLGHFLVFGTWSLELF